MNTLSRINSLPETGESDILSINISITWSHFTRMKDVSTSSVMSLSDYLDNSLPCSILLSLTFTTLLYLTAP